MISNKMSDRRSHNSRTNVSAVIKSYLANQGQDTAARQENYLDSVRAYYDLATVFYEYGWGECFHFAPRWAGQTVRESIVAHERWLATKLSLSPSSMVLDIGCGVGGPMREIARVTGCSIVGINSNRYQVARTTELNRQKGSSGQCCAVLADFMSIPMPDDSADAAYAIEATVHAPSLAGVYGEIARVLKPGGMIGIYEWCMTEKYDPQNQEHMGIKRAIEIGSGIANMLEKKEVLHAIKEAGLELIEARDRSEEGDIPWWSPLSGSFLSIPNFLNSRFGSSLFNTVLTLLEWVHIVPTGTASVNRTLAMAGKGLVDAGKRQIFTPMFFVMARKPENPPHM